MFQFQFKFKCTVIGCYLSSPTSTLYCDEHRCPGCEQFKHIINGNCFKCKSLIKYQCHLAPSKIKHADILCQICASDKCSQFNCDKTIINSCKTCLNFYCSQHVSNTHNFCVNCLVKCPIQSCINIAGKICVECKITVCDFHHFSKYNECCICDEKRTELCKCGKIKRESKNCKNCFNCFGCRKENITEKFRCVIPRGGDYCMNCCVCCIGTIHEFRPKLFIIFAVLRSMNIRVPRPVIQMIIDRAISR